MKKPFTVSVKKFLSPFIIAFFGVSLGAVEVTFEGKSVKLNLTVANTFESRRQGLMHQRVLKKNSGMIFIWPSSKKHCMWMKNTSLPLSVAYLTADGSIKEIYELLASNKLAS